MEFASSLKMVSSIVGRTMVALLEIEWADIDSVTVYGGGPVDMSAVIMHDSGRAEFIARDGSWFDSAGIALSGRDGDSLYRYVDAVLGHRDAA